MKPVQIYEGHTASVNAVKVTPDGKHIVSGSRDKTLRLWDLELGECQRVFEGHSGEVKAVVVLPDGKSCISASRDSTLRQWDLNTGICLKVFKGHSDDVNAVTLTPNGESMVSGSSDCTLRLWDVYTGQCLRVFDRNPACSYMDGLNRLIRSTNSEFSYHDYLVDLAFGVTYDRENFSFFGHADHVLSVAVTRNGKYILSGSQDNTLRLWDFHTGKCLWLFGGYNGGKDGSIHAVAVSPSGRYAISGCNTIQLWKISRNTLRRYLWGIVGERCHRRFKRHEDGVNAVAVLPKGKKILVASNWKNDLHLYSLRTGRRLLAFTAHEREINDVAVTPDCRFAISASLDGTLKRWDLKATRGSF